MTTKNYQDSQGFMAKSSFQRPTPQVLYATNCPGLSSSKVDSSRPREIPDGQVHKSLYGVPETKGSPVSKGLAGAIGTVPEVGACSGGSASEIDS